MILNMPAARDSKTSGRLDLVAKTVTSDLCSLKWKRVMRRPSIAGGHLLDAGFYWLGISEYVSDHLEGPGPMLEVVAVGHYGKLACLVTLCGLHDALLDLLRVAFDEAFGLFFLVSDGIVGQGPIDGLLRRDDAFCAETHSSQNLGNCTAGADKFGLLFCWSANNLKSDPYFWF